MQFHLPRPLHAWREFVGEVGIIVIGVLIALGAGQLVDDWNWRGSVEAHRKALDEDVFSLWQSLSARVVLQGCIDKRLKDIEVVFQRHKRGLPLDIVAPIGRPAALKAKQNALRMATADGALSHMNFSDRQAYFDVAGSFEAFAPLAWEERESWRVLQGLNEPASLTAADWSELRKAYRDAVDSNRIMKFNLVAGTPDLWLTAFAKFPRFSPNDEVLRMPFVHELCQPAVQR